MRSLEHDRPLAVGPGDPFARETRLYEKRRRAGDIAVAVCVPDPYRIAQPNLGHQHLEYLINQVDGFFAYRVYLGDDGQLVRESRETPGLVLLSMSYEGSYIRALRILDQGGIRRAFVSSTPDEGTVRLYDQAPDRIIPVLRPYRQPGELVSWFRDPTEFPSRRRSGSRILR